MSALIAFTILTGARDRATASIKLKHIDLDQGRILQDARQVNTKFSKTFTTWFFPVGDDILQVVIDWVIDRKHWASAGPIRKIFNERSASIINITSVFVLGGRYWPRRVDVHSYYRVTRWEGNLEERA